MAASMWNATDIRPPKRVLCPYEGQELINLGNLNKICSILKAIRLQLKGDRCLDTEIAFFDRMHYKLRSVFKSDKQMQATRKARSCLKRFCKVNIGTYCWDIHKDIDNYTTKAGDSAHVYLPSREMFLFILIRLQGIARLFAQTVIYLQEAFYYILQKTYLGHYVNVNILFLASVSRLWILLRNDLLLTLDWYRNLKPFTFKLKQTPDSANVNNSFKNLTAEDLPEDLSEWLGPEFKKYLQKKIVKPSAIEKSLHLLSGALFDEKISSEVELKMENAIASDTNDNGVISACDDDNSGSFVSALSEDFGVAVSRDMFTESVESKETEDDEDEFITRLNSVAEMKMLKDFCITAKLVENPRFTNEQLKKLRWFLKDVGSADGKCTIKSAVNHICDFWKHPETLDKYSREDLKSLAADCLPTASKKAPKIKKSTSTSEKVDFRSFKNGFDLGINDSLALLTSLDDDGSFQNTDLDSQLAAIKTKRHLRRFYLKEVKRRSANMSGTDALTAHFTPLQWRKLKRFLKDHFSDDSKTKLSAVRKQLRRYLKSPNILDDANTSKQEAVKTVFNSSQDLTNKVVNDSMTDVVHSSKKVKKRRFTEIDDVHISVKGKKKRTN